MASGRQLPVQARDAASCPSTTHIDSFDSTDSRTTSSSSSCCRTTSSSSRGSQCDATAVISHVDSADKALEDVCSPGNQQLPGSSTADSKLSISALLHGFPPALEQLFLSYKYQQTLAWDATAAIYHACTAISHVLNFPMSTWGQPAVQRGMAGFVLGWGLPALLVVAMRRRLGPKGREIGVLLIDVALAAQVRCMHSGYLYLLA